MGRRRAPGTVDGVGPRSRTYKCIKILPGRASLSLSLGRKHPCPSRRHATDRVDAVGVSFDFGLPPLRCRSRGCWRVRPRGPGASDLLRYVHRTSRRREGDLRATFSGGRAMRRKSRCREIYRAETCRQRPGCWLAISCCYARRALPSSPVTRRARTRDPGPAPGPWASSAAQFPRVGATTIGAGAKRDGK